MLEQSVTPWNDDHPSSSFLSNNVFSSSPTPSVENSGSSRFSPNPESPNPPAIRALVRDSDSDDSTTRAAAISRSTMTATGSLPTPAPSPPTPASSTPLQRSTKHNWTASDFIRSDFWFHDGNVVIIAGQAAFKVHRGQLERHSEVFSGLFGLPQPDLHDQDLVDGCPCVVFHDSPSDVFYFLSALYDGLYLKRYFKSPTTNDFPSLSAVLRLSTKYMVEHLRLRCLHRLHLDWPTTLLGWDQREAGATDDQGRYLPREGCAHPVLVIELALEMGVWTVLPAALYDLSRYGPSKILGGVRRPVVAFDVVTGGLKGGGGGGGLGVAPSLNGIMNNDFTFPSPSAVSLSSSSSSSSKSSSRIVQLVHPLLIKTLRGRESSQRYIANFLAKELCGRAPAVDCLNKEDVGMQRYCLESFYYIMLNVLRSVGGIACGRDADPLFTLVQALEMLSRTDFTTADGGGVGGGGENGNGTGNGNGNGEGGGSVRVKKCGLKMCTMCKVDFARAVAKAREEVWSLLPTWFGLV